MTSKRQSSERSARAHWRTSAAILIFALPALAGCVRLYGTGRRTSAARVDAAKSAVRALEVRVRDDVLLTGQVEDDAIPGNSLRRRSVARLPATLARALAASGFRVVETPRSGEVVLRFRAHLDLAPDSGSDYVGRRYVFEGTTTLLVEHGGRLVEAIDVSVPLVELTSPADATRVRRPGEAVDWRAYPDVLAKTLVDRLMRSDALAKLGRPRPTAPTLTAPLVARDSSKAGPAKADLRGLTDPDVRALLDGGPTAAALEHFEAEARAAHDRAARETVATRGAVVPGEGARPKEEPAIAIPSAPEAERSDAEVLDPPVEAPIALAFEGDRARSGPRRRAGAIAVFGIEDVSNTFGADVVAQLTDYLAVKVTEVLRQPVVARDELRQQLVAEKSKGYRDCVDQRCQIDLGRALSASRSLSTKLLRVGSTCAITLAMWDLETELAEHATSMRTECGEQAILTAIDRVVAQLGVPRGAKLERPFPTLQAPGPLVDLAAPLGLGAPDDTFEDTTDALTDGTLALETLSDGTVSDGPVSDGTGSDGTGSDGTVSVSTPGTALRAGVFEAVPVHIELRAPIAELAARPRLNLVLLLDTSSSMLTEGRVHHLRRAALVAARYLRAEDTLSIVSFAAAPKVLLPASRVSARQALGDLLAGMNVGGRANLAGGLQAALRELASNRGDGTISHVLTVTDSPITEGEMDTRGLEALAESVARAGATMTIVGLGADVDGGALSRLAERARGRYVAPRTADALPGLFARELGALASVSMSDVAVEVFSAPGVELASVEGRRARVIPGGLALDLGTLTSAERRSVSVALRGRCDAGGRAELARVRVRYRDWGDGGRTVVRDEPVAPACGRD